MTSDVNGVVMDRAKELEDDFSYENYEVARMELFAHLKSPAVTIRKDSTTFSAACINALEDTVYVQILIDRKHRHLAVRRCEQEDKDAIRWCVVKDGKRKSRKITSKEFSRRVYELMGWDEGCRYKMLGYKIYHMGEPIIVFVLDEHSIIKEHKRKTKKEVLEESETTGVSAEQIEQREAEEQKMARKPFYPDDWLNTFGVPVEEHHNVTIDTMDEFGSYSSDDNTRSGPDGRGGMQ